MNRKKSQFRFDVALSFAGRDRPKAEAVARAMQSIGLRVFYDKDHHAYLWGKRRTEYEAIYGPSSAFVVPMISKHYAEREWTQWEFETAKREAKNRKGDFILPIRLDDSRQFGLTDDHNYLSTDDFTPEEIAQALKAKLEAQCEQSADRVRRTVKFSLVLTAAAREALGIIVASPIPLTRRHLQHIFPNVEWSKHLRYLKRHQLINDDVLIDSVKKIEASFTDELAALEGRWQARLEELQDHMDCALFLALMYAKQKRISDAVRLVADVALAEESDRWLPLCIAFLEPVSTQPSLFRRLLPDTQFDFLRAFGHCLSESRRFDEARVQFEKLKRLAARKNDNESVGLALLNIGTNHHKQGQVETAVEYYERVRKHARRHKLPQLESHALGNLGQIEVEWDAHAAIELLRESIKLKKMCRDRVGIAGSLQVLAQAHAELEDFESALRLYDEAESLAGELSLVRLEALLLTNKAHTFLAANNRSEALRVFKKAQKLATAEGFADLHVRATEGISRVHYLAGKLTEAQTCMEELLECATEAKLHEFVFVAHHGLWATTTRLGDHALGSQHYRSLIRAARKENAIDWLVRGFVDSTRPIENGDFVAPDTKKFAALVQREARRQNRSVTAALWTELARQCAPENIDCAVSALRKCIACCDGDHELSDELMEAYEFLYTLLWDFSPKHEEAIQTLDALAAVARGKGNIEKELAAINQKATCLQELNQGDQAIPMHKFVAQQSLKNKLDWLAVDALHNLAECHRRLGQADVAMKVFRQARRIAANSADELSVIQIDHGYALALENAGKYAEAMQLFRRCRNRARKVERSEYLRASEAIANLSWTCGKMSTAVKQYRRALAECIDDDDVHQKVRISFNLSRLLRVLGNYREAYQILVNHIDLVDDSFELADFHSTLADLCEKTDRLDEARKHWRIAIDAAKEVGDEDGLVYCRSNYAEFERRHGDPVRSIREIDELLKKKISAEDRGIALVQLFKALVQRNSEKRAQEVFSLAEKHMQEHGPVARLVDLYMTLFDHNWNGEREARFTSLQAYVAAFVAAVTDDPSEDYITRVVSHVSITLTQRKTAPPMQQLQWLAKRLEDWLTEELSDAHLIATLMHPLRYAEKMIPLNNNPTKFLEMHDRVFAEFSEE